MTKLQEILTRLYGYNINEAEKEILAWHNSKQLTEENQYGMNYILLELVCRPCAGKIEWCEDHRFCHEYKVGKTRLKKAIKEAMEKK